MLVYTLKLLTLLQLHSSTCMGSEHRHDGYVCVLCIFLTTFYCNSIPRSDYQMSNNPHQPHIKVREASTNTTTSSINSSIVEDHTLKSLKGVNNVLVDEHKRVMSPGKVDYNATWDRYGSV